VATGCADAGLETGVAAAHPATIAVTVMARALAVTRGPFLRYRMLL